MTREELAEGKRLLKAREDGGHGVTSDDSKQLEEWLMTHARDLIAAVEQRDWAVEVLRLFCRCGWVR